MARFAGIIVAFAVGAVLTGCAAPIVFIPEQIGERGLLIGQVAADAMPDALDGSPVVDDRTLIAGMRRGYIVVALEPGEHYLSKLSRTVSSSSVSTAVGTYYYTVDQHYPIDQKFTIEAGKATNIGLLVMQPRSKADFAMQSSLFAVSQLDNSREMATFLRETHPTLYDSLKSKNFVLAPGKYLDAKQTRQMRHEIAARNLRDSEWLRAHPGAGHYVSGAAGTVAKVTRNAAGAPTTLKVIDTGTLADLNRCWFTGAHVGCLISTSEYLLIRDETVSRHAVPAGVTANSMMVFGDQGIVIVDDAMKIYTSLDDGRRWAVYDGARRQPLARDTYRPDPKHRFGFHAGRDGFYVFARGMGSNDTTMVYADYRTATYRSLGLPKSAEEIQTVLETDAGVFIGPVSTDFAKAKLHFLPAGKEAWETREIPQAGCRDIAIADRSGRNLQVLCRGDNVWKSENTGANWVRLFKVNSLFN